MDVNPLLHPSSSRNDPHYHHHHASSIVSRFILTTSFLLGNALTSFRHGSSGETHRPSEGIVHHARLHIRFHFAAVDLLREDGSKMGLAVRICRCSSMVAMAAVLVLLLSISALHQW
ncbi:hypothetical protein BT93_L1453 [Corymbia citriodora subsp. variegata]|uniref:Uncharacterized protein n=1 Tax=Corymbia citriodora subsp. variegata TaxID=360336 RepID=A0A8T0CML3_CORYI|nr:hypothetical protein BT93_L1453 [Corymbia citriodora subsp. variegata]